MALSDRLRSALKHLGGSYYKLVLVVGPADSGKTAALRELSKAHEYPIINLNLALSEQLLELTHRQRSLRVRKILEEIVAEKASDVLIIDNIEILFHPDLQMDPLKLLQSLARNRTVVSAWPGEVSGSSLIYAGQGHPEFKKYPKPDATLVRVDEDHTSAEQHEPAALNHG